MRPLRVVLSTNFAFRIPRKAPKTPQYSTLPDLPRSPNESHYDLLSFLNHASKTGLDPKSSVFYGTRYEYIVQKTLRDYAFSLSRLGQVGDRGVDLAGYWHLPFLPEPLRVIVQCKSSKRKILPEIIRGLEGAFAGAPAGWRGQGVFSILVSPLPASKGVRQALARSNSPLCWLTIKVEDWKENEADREGILTQALWNKAAMDEALEGVDVVLRHDVKNPEKRSVVLMWKDGRISGASIPDNIGTRPVVGE
ncbi:MAG: hypothetical protein Q9160_007732 [Pyrenula sp. 1 TL-2023]